MAEGMGYHLVCHYATMPRAGKAVEAVASARRFEDSLHVAILTIDEVLVQRSASPAGKLHLIGRPLADDARKVRAFGFEVVRACKRCLSAVARGPSKDLTWVFDQETKLAVRPRLRAVVKDNEHTMSASEVDGRKPSAAIEAWGVPLDTLRNAIVGTENRLPNSFDNRLQRMAQRG